MEKVMRAKVFTYFALLFQAQIQVLTAALQSLKEEL